MQLFCTIVFCAAFLFFEIFWWKNIGAKAAHIIMVKLTSEKSSRNVDNAIQIKIEKKVFPKGKI